MIDVPGLVTRIEAVGASANWRYSSDQMTGRLLRTLAASKPNGRFLEVGTGIGVGSAWILAGMDARSSLVGLEINANVATVARDLLKSDPRVTIHTTDSTDWLSNYEGPPFDFAFVDTTITKFEKREVLYRHLRVGAILVADDLLPQEKWTAEHEPRVRRFREEAVQDPHLVGTLIDWASGLFVASYVPNHDSEGSRE